MRPRRRLPLADHTNHSSNSASRLTRLKAPAHYKSCSRTSSIGSSTAPRSRCPSPPHVGAGIKGNNKSSKPVVKAGDMLPGACESPPPSKKARKIKKEQQHRDPQDHNFGNSLPSQTFIEKQRAYFAEVDAFELVEESVSGSDLE